MGDTVDFDSLDRVVNLVSKPTPTLTIKHIVKLTRTIPIPQNNNGGGYRRQQQQKLPYAYKWELQPNGRFNDSGMCGLYLNGTGYIQLVGTGQQAANYDETKNTKPKQIKCELQSNNFIPFLAMLDRGYDWLAGEDYRNTFILDESNRPLKIKDPLKRETCPLSQTSYVAIKPSIVRDSSNVRYEGILMLTPEGELTNFTAVEFASFRDQMKNLLPNLYTASTALVNQAISYSIYSKIKSNDAVNNNER